MGSETWPVWIHISCTVVSNSVPSHGLQPARFLCAWDFPGKNTGVGCHFFLSGLFPTQGSNPCLLHWQALARRLSRWCHSTISSSVIPFSSCPQSFPALGSFQRSQLFASGGQSIRISASTSVLPMNSQDWSPLEWTSWISLQSKGLSRVFSNTTVQKHQFFGHSAFFTVQLSHPHMTTGKMIALTRWTLVDKLKSLLFNMLSSLVITFLPRSKHLLISWLQSPSAVTLWFNALH